MSGILSGLAQMMSAPRKLRKALDNITLEKVKIEQGKLKVQQEQAKIARENNAVLLQDLEIELKKLQLMELQNKLRALGIGEPELNPPFWDG
jgi:hypothetical protein